VAPDVSVLLPGSGEVEARVTQQLAQTPLFAARFREASSRALLLPRRRPGGRTPLWQQRKRASDLLAAASKYPAFPMLLETYRECLRDVFDLPALVETLKAVESRAMKLEVHDPVTPSPFASSLLFGYVANYIYEGDAPLAERRAQALSVDPLQLRELLGDAELRELLDADVLHEVEAQLQFRDEQSRARSKDALHDVLLKLGDLSRAELAARSVSHEVAAAIDALVAEKRAVELKVGGEQRFVAVEHAARYRDALGVPLPLGLPTTLLEPVPDALGELLMRYARTHAPFPAGEPAARFGLTRIGVTRALDALTRAGRLLEGAFRPKGLEHEWSDGEVLARVRRRSLAKARREIEPVEPAAFGRLLGSWHGVTRKRRGLDATLDVVEKLQGLPLPASMLETEILPARLEQYLPSDLDALAAAGEVLWVGVEPMGERDGRVALYLTDHLTRLYRPPPLDESTLPRREQQVLDVLRARGASFFTDLHAACGGGFPPETLDALWSLVWRGVITNDSFFALRSLWLKAGSGRRDRRESLDGRAFRSRRAVTPMSEGRWALVQSRGLSEASATERSHALAQQLLNRYGLVTREVAGAEGIPGGFTAVSQVFSALEEAGKARRGYFVSGVGAMQFALPSVLELLRSYRAAPPSPEVVMLSAVAPANPYGALLAWPKVTGEAASGPTRSAGAQVVLVDGALVLWLSRGGQRAFAWLPEDEVERQKVAKAIATRLAERAPRRLERHEGLLLEINGKNASEHPLAAALEQAGFTKTASGVQSRRASFGRRARRA
ncbi:MAG: DEAD/DEAH box helicase, partial [Myxococcaceae bacterium]|nr:DEAD/DEAH box helicase [Myxococcaceae bacterium]